MHNVRLTSAKADSDTMFVSFLYVKLDIRIVGQADNGIVCCNCILLDAGFYFIFCC